MRITTKGRYGLRAVINLAMASHNRPISIGSIAHEEDVSSEFLEQIFFKLKKAGLIRSVRGPGGGFILNRAPAEISVQDILDAVGESHGLTPCTLRRKLLCNRTEPCAAHDVWTGLQETMESYLSGVTLDALVKKNGKGLVTQLSTGQDFSI
jgi:Rrf2 family transcriptional regulator, iron-sulfur cluster assembly transcription factor